MRICIVANSSRYIWNFRINLIKSLLALGHDVITCSPLGPEVSYIQSIGIKHIKLSLAPQSINPLKEIHTVLELRRLLSEYRTEIVLSSTPKGNLYTALANIGTNRKQIANVSGLGSAFIRQDWISLLVDIFYSLLFKRIFHIFFENPTDLSDFSNRGWVKRSQCELIPGLGVDLHRFSLSPWPCDANYETHFLMIARLIGDKGVREYVEAARIVRLKKPKTRFTLLGDSAADNPTGIDKEELANWIAEGCIVHHEHKDDVRPLIARAHCIILPSYREGMSRTLLEAGAMGRPLIATDVPGCREAIEVGINGLLCQPKNVNSLVNQIFFFLSLPSDQKQAMGIASHKKISMEFNESYVINRYIKSLEKI